MNKLSHVDNKQPTMVDVSSKQKTIRTAKAMGLVNLGKEIIALINNDDIQTAKGPVFQTAIIAGTQGVKKTADLIPFCHTLLIDSIKINITVVSDEEVEIVCTVKCEGKTGVEMEALTGVSTAALCIYDMCKAMSHDISIGHIHLVEKTGGKSDYRHKS